MEWIKQASHASILGVLICLVPAVAGVWFAIRPSEGLLALLRPLTLAAVFSALCSFVLSLTNGFRMVSRMDALDVTSVRLVGLVVVEGMVPVVVSLALLTVAWACVAIGMRRSAGY